MIPAKATALADEIAELAPGVARDAPTALARLEDWVRTVPGGGGGGDHRRARGEHSDPTGNSGIRTRSETYAQAHAALADALDQAHHALRTARRIIAAAMPVDEHVPDTPGCVSCARLAHWEPTHRGDLCRWCYDFRQEHQRIPPPELLRKRHDGRPIRTSDVLTALARRGGRSKAS